MFAALEEMSQLKQTEFSHVRDNGVDVHVPFSMRIGKDTHLKCLCIQLQFFTAQYVNI